MGRWQDFKEWLLPSGTFKRSETPQQDLARGRLLVFGLYCALAAVFLYECFRLLKSGRIEVMRTSYKVDKIEAPSLTICPFFAGTKLLMPTSGPLVEVSKVDLHGRSPVPTKLRTCIYDRECVCVDLFDLTLEDTSATERKTARIENVKNAAMPNSRVDIPFHEQVEVHTSLMDPSLEQTLKLGIYDSNDPAPNWFFSPQGVYSMGQLELQIWYVADLSFNGAQKTVMGDLNAMARPRHIFRYVSQEVGTRGKLRHMNETIISYEMRDFFVDEAVSSEKSYSIYTLAILLLMIAMRGTVIDIFFSVMFPVWKEKDESAILEMSRVAQHVGTFCLCFVREGKGTGLDPEQGETKPLLSDRCS